MQFGSQVGGRNRAVKADDERRNSKGATDIGHCLREGTCRGLMLPGSTTVDLLSRSGKWRVESVWSMRCGFWLISVASSSTFQSGGSGP